MITLASQGLTPDQILARRREQRNRAGRVYYAKNREMCSAKGRRWKAANPEAVIAASDARKQARAKTRTTTEWLITRPVKAILCQARRRAKKKKIAFDLVASDLLPLPTHCPVLGTKLNYGPGRGRKLYQNGAAASLDRIHNHLGYVKGNVIVISLRANLLKGQATIAELQKIASFYRRLSRLP